MAMNLPSIPFGSVFLQSPPFNSVQFPATSFAPGTASLQWATQIMDDIENIKTCVSKIDNIEKTVNKINSKVETLETKMKTMESKVNECEK